MDVILVPIIFIVVALFSFGSMFFNLHRRREFWRAFAQRYNGTFFDSQGWFSSTDDYVTLLLDGFEVRLDHYIVSSGDNSTTYQRVTINADSAAEFSAQIYKETPLFSKLGKAFGGQDIEVGHRAFDEVFIIKSNSPQHLIQTLERRVMEAHLNQRHMRVAFDGFALTVERVGMVYEHDAVLMQLRLATRYASCFFGAPKKQLMGASHVDVQDASPNSAW